MVLGNIDCWMDRATFISCSQALELALCFRLAQRRIELLADGHGSSKRRLDNKALEKRAADSSSLVAYC